MIRSVGGFAVAAAIALSGIAEARQYATWNPNDAHRDVILTENKLTASRAISSTPWVSFRATVRMVSGAWYWETTHYHTAWADPVVGIARPSFDLNGGPGFDVTVLSIGGPVENGDCYIADSVRVNAGSVYDGSVVRHWFDADHGIYRVAVDAGPWVTVAANLITGTGWYPVGGLWRPEGTSVSVRANFGQFAFMYDVPAGAHPGVFRDDEVLFQDGFDS